MIPIQDMQFATVETDDGVVVRGKLSFKAEYHISKFEMNGLHFDVVEHAKERMRYGVWQKCYGELMPPLYVLCDEARRNAPPHAVERINELVEKLMLLLSAKESTKETVSAK